MATILTQFLQGLTPPQAYVPAEYDGLEFRWRFFVFRPALFATEAWLLAAVFAYVAVYFYGRWTNSRKANKWLEANGHILEANFSSPYKWMRDGNTDYFNFSTGRRNVASLHTIFALKPRHDLFQWIYQVGRTWVDVERRYKDDLQLDFKLLPGVLPHDFVWGVVHRDELRVYKEGRWDLSFTRITENTHVSSEYMVMTEIADVTDGIVKAFPQISKIFEDPKIAPYFRSLSITDQPRDLPEKPLAANEREKHVILSLSVPPPSQADVTNEIVDAMFQFIDALPKVSIRPETKSRLAKRREEVDSGIKKEYERDKREEELEALEAKKAAKRKAEEERIAKLSASEQQKILERDRKRSLRKQQVKVRK